MPKAATVAGFRQRSANDDRNDTLIASFGAYLHLNIETELKTLGPKGAGVQEAKDWW